MNALISIVMPFVVGLAPRRAAARPGNPTISLTPASREGADRR